MRKNIIFLLVFCFSLCLALPTFAQEKTYPQGDFFLYVGVRNPIAPMVDQQMERILFTMSHVDIKNGKVTEDRTMPITFTLGVQDFNATASLKMDGDYDKTDGQMTGTFGIKLDVKDVWHGGVSDINSTWTQDYSGTFVGQVVDQKAVIRFKGKYNYEGHRGMADGTIQNISDTVDYRSVVVWGLSEYKAPEPSKVSDLDKEFLDKDGKPVDSGVRICQRDGEIQIHIPGTPEDSWKIPMNDTPIPYGAKIRTMDDSSATLVFPDFSNVTLKPETTFTMLNPPGNESKFKLVAGNILMNIKKIVMNGTMEVDSTQAVAGIKGTSLVASAEEDKTTFKVIEGRISVKALTGGQTMDLAGGKSATIDNAGKITTEAFDIPGELDTWDNAPQIDFAKFESYLPAENSASPAAQSAAPANAPGHNRMIYFILGAAIAVGVISAFILRKK